MATSAVDIKQLPNGNDSVNLIELSRRNILSVSSINLLPTGRSTGRKIAQWVQLISRNCASSISFLHDGSARQTWHVRHLCVSHNFRAPKILRVVKTQVERSWLFEKQRYAFFSIFPFFMLSNKAKQIISVPPHSVDRCLFVRFLLCR